jgi:hypothetical protein
MAQPTKKAPEIEKFLEQNFGRTTAINSDRCIPKPIGCGEPVGEFRDEVSRREYSISGLCQKCQDKIFGTGD